MGVEGALASAVLARVLYSVATLLRAGHKQRQPQGKILCLLIPAGRHEAKREISLALEKQDIVLWISLKWLDYNEIILAPQVGLVLLYPFLNY